ncbi:MAG: hypothetical protein IPL23_28430 [Saprospiraceae bacterium]|nr:hypothetical protein [Saprospiraceae bacterium]
MSANTRDQDIKSSYRSLRIGNLVEVWDLIIEVGSRLCLNVDLRADSCLTNLADINTLGINDLKK